MLLIFSKFAIRLPNQLVLANTACRTPTPSAIHIEACDSTGVAASARGFHWQDIKRGTRWCLWATSHIGLDVYIYTYS